jgi:dipeptidyl aminopeptidase/acylaminoacyl peptidase
MPDGPGGSTWEVRRAYPKAQHRTRGPVHRAMIEGRRRFSPRRVLVVLAVVACLALATIYLAAGVYGWQSLEIPHACGTREFAHQTPADFRASNATGSLTVDAAAYHFTDYRDVAFPARGSTLTIRGWYAPGPDGTASPTVVLANGIYSCRRDSVTLLPAAMLHKAGFGVLIADLRNHGDSDVDNGHSALGAKEYADLLGAWDWLVAQGHDPTRIGLFGTSLSGASSLIAMGEEPRIAATWADSSFADVDVLLGEHATSLGFPAVLGGAVVPVGRLLGEAELARRSPVRELERLAGRPIAIVQGLDDTQVLPHHAADLAAAAGRAGTRVEPWLVPGAGHQEAVLLRPDGYQARLDAFFRSALGGG